MRLLNIIFLSYLALVSSCKSQSDVTMSGLSDLISAEHAFAQTSLQKGIRTAFLTYLSDEAIIFRPEITKGKEWYKKYSASNNVLNWKPIYSDISSSGELGYTTGPWEYSKGDNPDTPIAFGHYVSIWKKDTDGNWKVNIDAGISHKPSTTFRLQKIKDTEYPATVSSNPELNFRGNGSSLFQTDLEFAKVSLAEGFANAFLSFASEDIRLYRDEHFPFVGKLEALEFLKDKKNNSTWNPHAAVVSKSEDLGYTYGIMENTGSDTGVSSVERSTYMRIWKRKPNGKWQLVLDVANQLPTSDKGDN